MLGAALAFGDVLIRSTWHVLKPGEEALQKTLSHGRDNEGNPRTPMTWGPNCEMPKQYFHRHDKFLQNFQELKVQYFERGTVEG